MAWEELAPGGRQAGARLPRPGPPEALVPHSPPPPPRHQRVRTGRHRVRAWPDVLQHPRQLPVCGHALPPRLPPGLQPRVRAAARERAGGLGNPTSREASEGQRPPSQKPQAGPRRCRLPDAGCGLGCTQHWGGRGRGRRKAWAQQPPAPQPPHPGTQHRTHTAQGTDTRAWGQEPVWLGTLPGARDLPCTLENPGTWAGGGSACPCPGLSAPTHALQTRSR